METLSSGHALQLLSLPDDSHGGRCFHPRFQRYPVRSRATSRSHRTGHIAPQLYSTPSLPGSAFISNNLWKAANLDKYKWLPCHPQIGRDAKCSFAKHKYEMPRRLRTNVFRCHGYMFPLRFGHLDSKSAPFRWGCEDQLNPGHRQNSATLWGPWCAFCFYASGCVPVTG